MGKVPIRAVQYLFFKKMKPTEMLVDIQKTLDNDSPSKARICGWVARFKRDDMAIEDEELPAILKCVTSPEVFTMCYVTEESQWTRLPRLWTCLLSAYSTFCIFN